MSPANGRTLEHDFVGLLVSVQFHRAGNEINWWNNLHIDPLPIAKGFWQQSRAKTFPSTTEAVEQAAHADKPQAKSPQQETGVVPNAPG